MFPANQKNANWTLAIGAFLLASSGATAQQPLGPPSQGVNTLMRVPLGETSEPAMTLSILTVAPGQTVPSHSHAGAVFAYILEGDIENQVEPEEAKIYHPGGFFHEGPRQVHRLLRNLSATEPAKILLLQNIAPRPGNAKPPLLQWSLPNLMNQEVSLTRLGGGPPRPAAAKTTPKPHQHPGPVFAYVSKGAMEIQVDPNPPTVYHAGEAFFEAPMHAHRLSRNVSDTEPAEIIVFQVGEIGQPLGLSVEEGK